MPAPDLERQIEFDFLRATETAALNTLQWLGRGEKEKADAAACDAIRGMFDLVDMRGEVTIGEGIKDEAPGLFKGERVGTWAEGSPRYEIALDPVDASSAQAACLQLTEDNEVFAVLGTLRGDEVLCYTEQHDTVAIANSDMTQERIDRSTAPYASVNARRERIIESLIDEASAAGLFDGRTVAVLSTDAIEVATDVAIPALNDVGVSVEFESLIQGDGTVGGAGAELAVNVESMRARGVDTVVVVGDATIPVNTFIGEGFFPTLIFTDQGSATAVAGRADLSGFDGVYSYGGTTPSDRFANSQFQEDCAAPWDEANPDRATQDPAVVEDGEPNHTVGLLIACRSLTVFTIAAEAAGTNLNNATYAAALEELGEFTLPGTNGASLGGGKYDAEDELRMNVYNPDAADDESAFMEFSG